VKRVKVQIDEKHTRELLAGKPIAIRIPADAQVLEIRTATFPDRFAKLLDVFFNGRPA
jgi:hypothetical protein